MNPMAWRLLWRQQRWELTILIGGSLLVAAAMAFDTRESALFRPAPVAVHDDTHVKRVVRIGVGAG